MYTCHSQYIEYAYVSSTPRPHGGATVAAITIGGDRVWNLVVYNPWLHLFVTKPHFSPNRNIGPNYCTMLMLAIKHRHDDHSRLSSSGNVFFDVWHNLPFKKEGILCCFLEWKRL